MELKELTVKLNGGLCVDYIGHAKCHCPNNFDGDSCEFIIDSCSENSCKNNASCEPNSLMTGLYKCKCPEYFIGSDCSIDLRLISAQTYHEISGFSPKNHCLNNGISILTNETNILSSKCLCLPGSMGDRCQIVKKTFCSDLPCYYGSICIASENSFKCICPEGFTGLLCDQPINNKSIFFNIIFIRYRCVTNEVTCNKCLTTKYFNRDIIICTKLHCSRPNCLASLARQCSKKGICPNAICSPSKTNICLNTNCQSYGLCGAYSEDTINQYCHKPKSHMPFNIQLYSSNDCSFVDARMDSSILPMGTSLLDFCWHFERWNVLLRMIINQEIQIFCSLFGIHEEMATPNRILFIRLSLISPQASGNALRISQQLVSQFNEGIKPFDQNIYISSIKNLSLVQTHNPYNSINGFPCKGEFYITFVYFICPLLSIILVLFLSISKLKVYLSKLKEKHVSIDWKSFKWINYNPIYCLYFKLSTLYKKYSNLHLVIDSKDKDEIRHDFYDFYSSSNDSHHSNSKINQECIPLNRFEHPTN